MEGLLQWAIINGATASEDAPARDSTYPQPKPLDPAVLDVILGKPASVQMTECLDAVEHSKTPLEAREIALDDLEMLVENIDNANNLEPLGMWPRLIKLFDSSDPSIRVGALWVSGTAVQNNPKAQAKFSGHDGLESALRVLKDDNDSSVRTKALYCVSSCVRGNVQGLTEFIGINGLPTLMLAIENGTNGLRQKAFFLLRSLIDEAVDTETPEELRPGMYLPNAIAEMGFIDAVATALEDMSDTDQGAGPAFEQAVEFLIALCTTEDGKHAIETCKPLRSAVSAAKKQFPGIETDALEKLL
ncbi:Fes1-domain-containing protein [Coemansia reversa NRRL 1564]|uniref:Fes1-domain-containing protein n=1 Tax=Coemansia reversa (strain ATCC 12441 / NRRL 1564) TaxID=763665 RepID=A0A2G5B994_COERN|nr:Fes1-domain-containing protein [Coemansia reversa NRRL 1564]|eukprot:PIA15586.1 Fes1-domain-containing protein [Coemansia reversa NRRL 1564]